MTDESLIEKAAKTLTSLTDAEWDIATAEGTEHLAGYFDAARRVLAVFEEAHAPTPNEREALARSLGALEADADAPTQFQRGYDQAVDDCAEAVRRSVYPEPDAPWDRGRACFGHCDKEGWYAECASKAEPEPHPATPGENRGGEAS